MQTKSRFNSSATAGSSYDSPSMTWHQWHHTAPMSRRIGFFSCCARANAASPHGDQWTGSCAADFRYADGSEASYIDHAAPPLNQEPETRLRQHLHAYPQRLLVLGVRRHLVRGRA